MTRGREGGDSLSRTILSNMTQDTRYFDTVVGSSSSCLVQLSSAPASPDTVGQLRCYNTH